MDWYEAETRRKSPRECRLDQGSTCEECSKLEAFDHKFYETLKQLQKERKELLQSINRRHDPFVLRFPPELASRIFQLCMPIGRGPYVWRGSLEVYEPGSEIPKEPAQVQSPEVLTMVCRDWRQIATSTPNLWTDIPIFLEKRDLSAQLDVLARRAKWSASLPLSIGVWTRPSFFRYTNRDPLIHCEHMFKWLPTFDFVNSLLHRWKCLRLILPDFALSSVGGDSDYRAPFPTLEELHLECLNSTADTAQPMNHRGFSPFLNKKAQPSKLYLRSIPSRDVRILWSRLTQIDLDSVYTIECVGILRDAPHLQGLSVGKFVTGNPTSHRIPPSLPHTVHSTLHHLSIAKAQELEDGMYFFDFVTLPALNRMTVNHCALSDNALRSLIAMISRSGCPIKAYTMINVCQTPTLVQLLRVLPSLTELGVLGYALGILDHLTEPIIDSNNSAELQGRTSESPNISWLLPNLQSLLGYLDFRPLDGMIPRPARLGDRQHIRPLQKLKIVIANPISETGECRRGPHKVVEDRVSVLYPTLSPYIRAVANSGFDISVFDMDGPGRKNRLRL